MFLSLLLNLGFSKALSLSGAPFWGPIQRGARAKVPSDPVLRWLCSMALKFNQLSNDNNGQFQKFCLL